MCFCGLLKRVSVEVERRMIYFKNHQLLLSSLFEGGEAS